MTAADVTAVAEEAARRLGVPSVSEVQARTLREVLGPAAVAADPRGRGERSRPGAVQLRQVARPELRRGGSRDGRILPYAQLVTRKRQLGDVSRASVDLYGHRRPISSKRRCRERDVELQDGTFVTACQTSQLTEIIAPNARLESLKHGSRLARLLRACASEPWCTSTRKALKPSLTQRRNKFRGVVPHSSSHRHAS